MLLVKNLIQPSPFVDVAMRGPQVFVQYVFFPLHPAFLILLNFSFTKVAVSFVIYIKVESQSLGHLQGLAKVESDIGCSVSSSAMKLRTDGEGDL